MQQNHSFIGSEHSSQASRTTREIAKNRSGSLSNEPALDNRGQNASWGLPGSVLEGFGSLPGLSWPHLGRSWAAFEQLWDTLGPSWAPVRRMLGALGRIWALTGASGLDFGGFQVPPGWVLESSGGSFRDDFR